MKRILFVCTGNICRSAMAEYIFNDLAEKNSLNYRAESAGIYAMRGYPMDTFAQRYLKSINIDGSGHTASSVNFNWLNDYKYIFVMTKEHLMAFPKQENAFLLTEFVGEKGEVKDPWGWDISVFEACGNQLYELIYKLIEKLKIED